MATTLIAAEHAGAHRLALDQLRGGFAKEINALREALIGFAGLLELELDFAEEDVCLQIAPDSTRCWSTSWEGFGRLPTVSPQATP